MEHYARPHYVERTAQNPTPHYVEITGHISLHRTMCKELDITLQELVTKKIMDIEKEMSSALEEKSAKRKMSGSFTSKKKNAIFNCVRILFNPFSLQIYVFDFINCK